MKKPTKQSRESFDFHDCTRYLEDKYKMDTRDYGGKSKWNQELIETVNKKFKVKEKDWYSGHPKTKKAKAASKFWDEEKKNEPPYLDFWHHILDLDPSIHNGSYFRLSDEDLVSYNPNFEIQNWQKELIELYLSEFGEDTQEYTTPEERLREVEFWVEW